MVDVANVVEETRLELVVLELRVDEEVEDKELDEGLAEDDDVSCKVEELDKVEDAVEETAEELGKADDVVDDDACAVEEDSDEVEDDAKEDEAVADDVKLELTDEEAVDKVASDEEIMEELTEITTELLLRLEEEASALVVTLDVVEAELLLEASVDDALLEEGTAEDEVDEDIAATLELESDVATDTVLEVVAVRLLDRVALELLLEMSEDELLAEELGATLEPELVVDGEVAASEEVALVSELLDTTPDEVVVDRDELAEVVVVEDGNRAVGVATGRPTAALVEFARAVVEAVGLDVLITVNNEVVFNSSVVELKATTEDSDTVTLLNTGTALEEAVVLTAAVDDEDVVFKPN